MAHARIVLFALLAFALPVIARTADQAYDLDKDPFYEKARFIMSKEEEQIYKHLADDQDRKEFVKEFWEIRSPTPEGEVNQAEQEFQRRIEYANRTFRETSNPHLGWNTDRGRILLMLGMPDQVFKQKDYDPYYSGVKSNPHEAEAEYWYYEYYSFNLTLMFLDRNGMGKFELQTTDSALFSAMDIERSYLGSANLTRKWRFKYEPLYEKGALRLKIPSKVISWEESGERMRSEYSVKIIFYSDYKKITQQDSNLELAGPREDLLKQKNFYLDMPLPALDPGKYFLDIVVIEKISGSRYRQGLTCKIR